MSKTISVICLALVVVILCTPTSTLRRVFGIEAVKPNSGAVVIDGEKRIDPVLWAANNFVGCGTVLSRVDVPIDMHVLVKMERDPDLATSSSRVHLKDVREGQVGERLAVFKDGIYLTGLRSPGCPSPPTDSF